MRGEGDSYHRERQSREFRAILHPLDCRHGLDGLDMPDTGGNRLWDCECTYDDAAGVYFGVVVPRCLAEVAVEVGMALLV